MCIFKQVKDISQKVKVQEGFKWQHTGIQNPKLNPSSTMKQQLQRLLALELSGSMTDAQSHDLSALRATT